jgi:hypothetical protein
MESNLLGFPLFALHTKGLAKRKYIQVTGSKYLPDGSRRDFSLTISRSAQRLYPGPLARKIHYALNDILQQPAVGKDTSRLEGPAVFTWRNLHDRMQVSYHGTTSIQRCKDAIFDTVGATIFTDYAFMQRASDARVAMPARETGYHVYEKCMFINDPLPGGGTSDKNAVWLADWYLANLNAFMTAPIDYSRWLRMNHESPLASRIYEFATVKFNRSIPFLQINYPYFVSFLPATAHTYLADAQRQLEAPFEIARLHDVIADVEWSTSRDGQIQLRLHPGSAIRGRAGPRRQTEVPGDEADFDRLTVFEAHNDESSESELVRRFHSLRFDRSNHRPIAAELSYARELLTTFNPALLHRLLPKIADTVREQFPSGKLLNAARPYVEELIAQQHRQATTREKAAEDTLRLQDVEQQTTKDKQQRKTDEANLRAAWRTLPHDQQQRHYDAAIAAANSEFQRLRLRRRQDFKNPPREVLQQLEKTNKTT